ncbi:hypothetical protein C1H46_034305 [Malus baccata]|uniref:Uncharacterized protein n=1 Tax=Malus baccata TaxID=106549 RepID=A0A540L0W4_MALBA|nr:hypothetical protein C1H46_034305 [Malus baccata]
MDEFVKLGGSAQVDVHVVVLDLPAKLCISWSVKGTAMKETCKSIKNPRLAIPKTMEACTSFFHAKPTALQEESAVATRKDSEKGHPSSPRKMSLKL